MRKCTVIAVVALVACALLGCQEEFRIIDLSPKTGVMSGNEPIFISGSGFKSDMGVTIYFGTVKAGNVVVNGPDQITVTTPPTDNPQTVDVRVLTDAGREFVLRQAFRYVKKSAPDIGELGQRKSKREKQE